MCGIAGVWAASTSPTSVEAIVTTMARTLRHRGPDDEGSWCDRRHGIAFAHTRLSIIDLSPRSKQPMRGPSGKTHITFNGEIYNYRELRRDLEAEGVPFENDSDTLVIAAAYERYGIECVRRLRGMFAFGLWDSNKNSLLLARDRVRKKPLYYTVTHGTLLFASEMKALLAVMPSPSTDPVALDEYLSCGFVSGERTIYEGIRELPPGSMVETTLPTSIEPSFYWRPRWNPKLRVSTRELLDRTESVLSDAVHLRLRADVPVGVFLSGGIDSGLITALAARQSKSRLHSFSVGFDDSQTFDERGLANLVAKRYATEHHEVVLRPDVVSLIPKIAGHYDEPFGDPSAIPSFAIAEFASQHVKVVLNGDGGDELFAGYRRHLAACSEG